MREWINQFWRELSFLISDSEDMSISDEIILSNKEFILDNGQLVSLSLSHLDIYDEMEAVEYEAYNQVRSWKASDFEFDMLHNRNSFYLQAFIEQKLIGFIGCRQDRTDVHISNFVIHPAYQSQGIGGFLMYELIKIIPQVNRQMISLEVRVSNQSAQRFYESFGFVADRIKQRYYIDNQEDAVVMLLDLR